MASKLFTDSIIDTLGNLFYKISKSLSTGKMFFAAYETLTDSNKESEQYGNGIRLKALGEEI